MKAIRVEQFGGPEVLRLQDVPDPAPGPGQVLVRVHAAGINPIDTYIRSGSYAAKPALPYTPGSDAAGVVESLGEGVPQYKAGDRVYVGGSVTGTYAQFTVCESDQVHPLPEKVSFKQGAGINTPYVTAYRALFQRAQGIAGETVLIHGATGGVGIASVQLARAAVDHRAADYLKQLMDLTGGRGVEVILEMLANVNLAKDLTLLAKGGRVAVIGSRGPVEINPRDAMSRDAVILGVMQGNASPKERASIHAALYAGLENSSLRPVIGKELPLAEAARGHQAVMEPGAHGKIVLIP
jgi:NADPH2:quinone reductase